MAKKRKAPGASHLGAGEEHKRFEERGGKIGPIMTYEDVADSEDEFHINRDKIMLDDGPDAKRRRKWAEQDAFLEPSDEEVLAYSSDSSEDDDSEDPKARGPAPRESEDEDGEEQREEEEDEEGWGHSRKDYYNADTITTEVDAQEEEAEALRLQKRKLEKMSEADFGFDESEWLDNTNIDDDADDHVVEVLKDVEITAEMSAKERLHILQVRYPEFEFLANEFLQLQPVLQDLQQQTGDEKGQISTTMAKCRALAAYVSALSMYFALLTSPTGPSAPKTLDPAELRDHPIMDSLLQCRELWTKVKKLKTPTPAVVATDSEDNSALDEEVLFTSGASKIPESGNSKAAKKSKKARALETAASEAAQARASRIQAAEDSLADLSSLLPSRKPRTSKPTIATYSSDNESDFGEAESLDAKSAAAKAAKKKSLRFYTSQITQKSNKRAGAGRDAGGDEDLPYRERFRDRQMRLNAEAEARGKKLESYGRGVALGEGDSDAEDGKVAEQVRGEEDEYYDMIAQTSKSRKKSKEDKADMIKKANAENKMVRFEEEVGEDGEKRAIGYVIEKNKGLAPKRKKDVRNPRVKKRKKYEEKKKKLASSRAVFKGGEERGGYGGEKTGIKTGLVKSVKLA